jgi:hypothetical protein
MGGIRGKGLAVQLFKSVAEACPSDRANVFGSKMTAAGVKTLREAPPKCYVKYTAFN